MSQIRSLLFLDLGTTTGFAVGNAGAMASGTWGLKPGRHDGGGMRFVKFRARLNELKASIGIDAVYYEEVRRHLGVDAAHIYGGFMAHLTEWCESQDPPIPYEGVPVQAIKMYATGKGNAKKDVVIAAVESWGYRPCDDNEADAIAGFWLKAVELGLTLGHEAAVVRR